MFLSKLQYSGLPLFPKLCSKIALGLSCLIFLSTYQPTVGFPPVKESRVLAESIQTQTITAATLPVTFQLPHPGYMSTSYSRYHQGIDIASGLGMPIKPIAKGVITSAGFNFWGLGLTVAIDHGYGYKSLYAHLGKIYVKPNQAVSENDLLGVVGVTGNTSGPHTHLEVSRDGININPQTILPAMDSMPAYFYPQKPQGGKTEKQNLDFRKELQKSL